MRTGAMGVRKMRSLRKKKADLGKKMMKKKRALQVLVQMLSLDDRQLELTDPELIFSAEELELIDPELIFSAEELLLDPTHYGQILGAEEEIDNGDGSLNIDAQLEKEEEEEGVQIFLASFDEWVDNHGSN